MNSVDLKSLSRLFCEFLDLRKEQVSAGLVAPTRLCFSEATEDLDSDHPVFVSTCELGYCVRASRLILKGELVYRYVGREINFAETKTLGEMECMPLQYDVDKYLDTVSPGRFVNHSCEPNAGIQNNFDLVALEDIAANVEIRFDYSTTMSEDSYTMECKCTKPSCRGIVTDFKYLPLLTQQRYLSLGVVSDFIKRTFSSPGEPA